MLEVLKSFKGAFSREGEVFDYVEIHSFQLGFIAGASGRECQKAYDEAVENMSHDIEYHYFKSAYLISNRVKWVGAGAGGLTLLPHII